MSEFYGDNGEVWDGEEDDPQLGGMGIVEVTPPKLRPVRGRPGYFFAPVPWYVRLWRWVVGGYPAS